MTELDSGDIRRLRKGDTTALDDIIIEGLALCQRDVEALQQCFEKKALAEINGGFLEPYVQFKKLEGMYKLKIGKEFSEKLEDAFDKGVDTILSKTANFGRLSSIKYIENTCKAVNKSVPEESISECLLTGKKSIIETFRRGNFSEYKILTELVDKYGKISLEDSDVVDAFKEGAHACVNKLVGPDKKLSYLDSLALADSEGFCEDGAVEYVFDCWAKYLVSSDAIAPALRHFLEGFDAMKSREHASSYKMVLAELLAARIVEENKDYNAISKIVEALNPTFYQLLKDGMQNVEKYGQWQKEQEAKAKTSSIPVKETKTVSEQDEIYNEFYEDDEGDDGG